MLGLLNNDRELERDHLTSLPAMDMEHFMYRQGFDDVYHRVAQIPDNVPMNMRRVITSRPSIVHPSPTWRSRWRWRPADAGGRGADAVKENVLAGTVAGSWSCRLTCAVGLAQSSPVAKQKGKQR
ncbi:hypothetical protein LNP17_10245 [Klebsiella variicola subsp. variicola]|nr:hypothetical protein [Klebsiella variicola subsp. variicola]